MREDTAGLLADEGGELRESYSGRAMYGKTTFAVTFDAKGDFERALVRAGYELGRQGSDDVEAVLSDLDGLRTDSMGLGIIVY
jgi:hypothetical protein